MSGCSLSDHSTLSKAKGLMDYHGPGIWFCFHTMSYNTIGYDLSISLIYFIKKTINSFKCSVCRTHALKYLKQNPPELKINNLFQWTVDFHNDVNHHKGKQVWSYTKAYNLYKEK